MRDVQTGELFVYDTPQQLAQALADAFVQDAAAAIEVRGAFYVALSGGTTPKAAYVLLAQEPRRSRIDWSRVQVFFGDERCVPPDSGESNYRMASEAFLRGVGIPQEQVHRLRGEIDPAQAAQEYRALLIGCLGSQLRFDTILLGMGDDGHTASLFPGQDPCMDAALLVRAPFVPKLNAYRLTITPLIINAARHVAIATEGAAKAPAAQAVREGPCDPLSYPIQIVAPMDGRLSWYVDRAAAARLTFT